MPRQSRSTVAAAGGGNPSDDDSQKENYASVRVKLEKQKGKGKEKKKRAEEEEEEEEEGEAADDEEQGSGSPKGRKRARVNIDGDSRPTEGEGGVPKSAAFVRDPKDGFIAGSIARIQLCNFVTYDYVEFRPGPYLNMIIGPNGTGKSSIACAIALGLNFSPKVLGRAEQVSAFVKNGTEEGHIEIELKSHPGKPNLVIRRKLDVKSKNSSNFWVDGRIATGKEVSTRMAELGVQVGNLCSFLPQDKVSEFAMMSPQQLLRETEKAAGDTNLTSWHESLIEMGKEIRIVKEKIQTDQSLLTQLQTRNAAVENEVERYHERKKIEGAIEVLTVFIPCARYKEMLDKYQEIKNLQRKLHQKVKKLKAKNEPAHELLSSLKNKMKTLERTRESRKKDTQKLFSQIKKLHGDNEDLESTSETLQNKLEHLSEAEKDRVRQIRELEAKIQRMHEEWQEPLDEETLNVLEDRDGSVKKERTEINRQRTDLSSRRDEFDSELRSKMESKAITQRKVEQVQNALKDLNSVDHQKLQMLAKFHRDTADAVVWLRKPENAPGAGRFKLPIIEPALLTLTIPNKNYASAFEGMVGAHRLRTFVAQCQEDYDTLNELVNDGGVLGRKAWVSVHYRPEEHERRATAKPPMERAEMEQLGFGGYLNEFVNAPEAMMRFLCAEMGLHRIAIALKPNSVSIPAATQLVARSGGASFVIGSVVSTVSRSMYGKKAISNNTRELRPARFFVSHTVDADAKRRLESEMNERRTDLGTLDDELERLKDKGRAVEAEVKELDKRGEKLSNRIKAANKKKTDKDRLKETLTNQKNLLKTRKAAPSADQERAKIRSDLVANAKKRVKIVKEYVALTKRIVVEQEETTRVGLEYCQISSNKAALEALCEKKDEKYNKAMAEFSKVDAEYEAIKKESRTALEESRAALDDATDEIREQYHEVQGKRTQYEKDLQAAETNGTTPPSAEGVDLRTSDEYSAELEAQKVQLELVSKTQPGVIEQYEKRKNDIEQLERTLEERQRSAARVERSIKATLDRWKPALEKLVGSIGQKFSAAFDRIGCAGEIRINENEDYDKWAIDILVKFRDEEKLQLLTGQRQSGGERSLTTILYLMSLTEEARAPFSLVDEINQGMDQRAERVVHNNMVDVTCKDDSAQYFLITPKLLPDLKYHERMKVLCVNNGEWLPEETKVGNLMNLIEGFVSHRNSRTTNGH